MFVADVSLQLQENMVFKRTSVHGGKPLSALQADVVFQPVVAAVQQKAQHCETATFCCLAHLWCNASCRVK